MKTIGLIGGVTWLSTAEYYRILNEMVNAREGGVSSARIIVFSVNFQEIKTLTEAGDWNSIAGIMCDAARRLERSGADCILLGANTMHKIADAVQEAVAIPLIHVAVVTASAIKQQQIRTVALLGTKYVMQQDFYRQKLEEQGLQVLIHSQADIDYINNAIYTEFAKGIFTEEAKQRFLQIIDTLVAQGASGAIFGCTEIPILLKQEDCSIPVFDTTLLHATAAVDFVLS
ncbi:MAG: aspartate/glutamate racemase family protein [Chitinophagaceae bacterium]|nr:aspartate/glutamate racemase family protein [Chitinophagaceae bacterium]